MHHMSARDAKNGFGRLIDLARAEPVAVEKHGRPVVIVLAVEEYARLTENLKKQPVGARDMLKQKRMKVENQKSEEPAIGKV